MPLSKSSFLKFLQCPEYFWFDQHRPEVLTIPQLNDFEQMLAEQGKKVEEEFYALYPNLHRITSLGQQAVQETIDIINQGVAFVAQAAFVTDDLFAQSDMVHFKADRHIDIYEIKSSSSMQNMGVDDGPPTPSKEEHVTDLAFQYIVAINAGYHVDTCFLIEVNKEYRRHGELDRETLFIKNNVTDEVLAKASVLEDQIQKAMAHLHRKEQPVTCPCRYLPRKKQCPAFSYLHTDLMEYAVYDLARIGNSIKRLHKMVDSGIVLIKDIPDGYDLTESHRDQVHAWNTGEIIIRRNEIERSFNALAYPLYFLDYETTSTAIPQYEGVKPYMHVPFQYSLHIIDAPGLEAHHTEYLHSRRDNPMYALSQHMRDHIGDEGTIIVWNKSFESKCNQNMASIVHAHAAFLNGLNTRMYDLMEIFSKRYHVHKDFKGSSSIKKVLPVLVPELSYENLAIADGGTATTQWAHMVFVMDDENEKQLLYQQLLDYCKLDTLAMVEIYKRLLAMLQSSPSNR